MNETDADNLLRENAYLRKRCAQLQGDVTDLGAQVLRLQTQLERLHGRGASLAPPNPLSGGQ
ncbi:MAG TPA: hypothetical protein VGS12_05400 [Caulobacteraceae bacterium]|nr:hypothetical protein [Caulobacteraceae bacterium]